jgi:predicted XRE-type DNA-binding protein
MRSDLMCELRIKIRDKEWTQAEAAKVLGISQSRISDLRRGKFEKFSLDMLITLATRAENPADPMSHTPVSAYRTRLDRLLHLANSESRPH